MKSLIDYTGTRVNPNDGGAQIAMGGGASKSKAAAAKAAEEAAAIKAAEAAAAAMEEFPDSHIDFR